MQERDLAPNTIHGFFQVVRAFGNWAEREGYPVDPALLRVSPPKVPQKEMETYTEAQLAIVLQTVRPGWSRLAIQILLGTGMRVSELVALRLEDVEDDGDVTFLKIRRGKGAKFRRVPVSSRLRRELIRYVNRVRPDARSSQLLLLANGRPVSVITVVNLLRRIRSQVGFPVHAHRFRHTFATQYLRNWWRDRAAAPDPRPHELRDGHALPAPWTRATWGATSTYGRRSDGRPQCDD